VVSAPPFLNLSACERQVQNVWCSKQAPAWYGSIMYGAPWPATALDRTANKTDANDAHGLAHLAEVGFFREVRVKCFDSVLSRTLVAARANYQVCRSRLRT
jgi:heme oxygenase